MAHAKQREEELMRACMHGNVHKVAALLTNFHDLKKGVVNAALRSGVLQPVRGVGNWIFASHTWDRQGRRRVRHVGLIHRDKQV